jgi:N-acyl homoserine lactone hydrolase
MTFDVDVLFPGFSGRLANGRLGWGTTALLRDGEHNVLMDTGGMVVRHDLAGMLAEHGLGFGDIDTVLLSHLHADHSFNVDYFPQAEFVLSRAEWEHANDLIVRDRSVNEGAIALLRSFRTRLIVDEEEQIHPGLNAWLTPGHTRGAMSYVVVRDDGDWVLTGDAVKNRGELEFEEVQQSVDMAASLASLRAIKQRASRVLPGHDGWLSVVDGTVIPEGGNDVVLNLSQGLTVNGHESITLTMGWNRPTAE